MGRPRYETAADRTREAGAAKRFGDALGLSMEKMPQGHRADFVAKKDDEAIGYIEVKTRTCNSTTYDTYHVSKDKLKALADFGQREGKRVALVVQWKDRTGFIGVGKFLSNATFKTGGRWDRNDPFDVEEMAEIPISYFTFI